MYGIEIIGYGKNRRFCLKKLVRNGTNPVDGKIYCTEDAARNAAENLGLTVLAVGDLWDLCAAYERSMEK